MSFFLFSTHEIFENKKLKSFNVYFVIGNVYLCISINICINLMIEKREEEEEEKNCLKTEVKFIICIFE
jgi:hypothetical protein